MTPFMVLTFLLVKYFEKCQYFLYWQSIGKKAASKILKNLQSQNFQLFFGIVTGMVRK